MADYSKCAHEMGISPDEFLEEFNPMYEKGLDKLAPYVTALTEFDPSSFQILIVNNSSNPITETDCMWQGVLHSATVLDNEGSRVINSTCVAPSGFSETDLVSADKVQQFLDVEAIANSYA